MYPERDRIEEVVGVGRAVVYLASRDGGFVTGTTLMVDGGYNYLR